MPYPMLPADGKPLMGPMAFWMLLLWLGWGIAGFLSVNLMFWLAGRETSFEWLWKIVRP